MYLFTRPEVRGVDSSRALSPARCMLCAVEARRALSCSQHTLNRCCPLRLPLAPETRLQEVLSVILQFKPAKSQWSSIHPHGCPSCPSTLRTPFLSVSSCSMSNMDVILSEHRSRRSPAVSLARNIQLGSTGSGRQSGKSALERVGLGRQ